MLDARALPTTSTTATSHNYLATDRPKKIIGIGREVVGLRKDGAPSPWTWRSARAALGGRQLFAGIVRDLTEKKRTDELLRRSEESFRLLVDNVRDYAITWLDTEGRIATWNAGAERTYGWSAAEAVGQPMQLFYPPEAAGEAERALRQVRENGRFDGDGWRIRKDGRRFWAHVMITPLWDEKGRMRGYVRVAQDITERKRVRRNSSGPRRTPSGPTSPSRSSWPPQATIFASPSRRSCFSRRLSPPRSRTPRPSRCSTISRHRWTG